GHPGGGGRAGGGGADGHTQTGQEVTAGDLLSHVWALLVGGLLERHCSAGVMQRHTAPATRASARSSRDFRAPSIIGSGGPCTGLGASSRVSAGRFTRGAAPSWPWPPPCSPSTSSCPRWSSRWP